VRNTVAAVMVLNSAILSPQSDELPVDIPDGVQLNAQCSAYVATGNRTATGVWPSFGTVAVDPRVIPLGSRLTIEGFEGVTFRAEDTGGAVNGARVDIFMSSYNQAIQYGRRPCSVTVLTL